MVNREGKHSLLLLLMNVNTFYSVILEHFYCSILHESFTQYKEHLNSNRAEDLKKKCRHVNNDMYVYIYAIISIYAICSCFVPIF